MLESKISETSKEEEVAASTNDIQMVIDEPVILKEQPLFTLGNTGKDANSKTRRVPRVKNQVAASKKDIFPLSTL